jgi:hypothetical protein
VFVRGYIAAVLMLFATTMTASGPRRNIRRKHRESGGHMFGGAAREVTMLRPIELVKSVAPTPVSVTTAPRRIVGEKHRNWSR